MPVLIGDLALFRAYYFLVSDGRKFGLKFAMPDRDSHQDLMRAAWDYALRQYDEPEILLFGLRYLGIIEHVDIAQQ
jgi:hypothetical protein